jgi:hypothetical protein
MAMGSQLNCWDSFWVMGESEGHYTQSVPKD